MTLATQVTALGFPRPRGDEPTLRPRLVVWEKFSPPARG